MSPAVSEALAVSLATLVQLVPTPVEPFGFGRDLWCTTDLHPQLIEVDENSEQAIGQAEFRRLITERGTLQDDQEYGFNTIGLLSAALTPADIRAAEGSISAECQKDDRADATTSTVTSSNSLRTLDIAVRITPTDPTLNDISLTFAVTSGGAVLEEIS